LLAAGKEALQQFGFKGLSDCIGCDAQISRHVAHLFIRDPLVIFQEKEDANITTEDFENLQSTNWQTVRFKPPPSKHLEFGYRVEFRTMEVSVTEFENAAYSVFIVLFARALIWTQSGGRNNGSYIPNCCNIAPEDAGSRGGAEDLYIPLSLVDENLERAHARDAIHQRKFWYKMEGKISERSTGEIVDSMLSLIKEFETACSGEHFPTEVWKYLEFIRARANGTLWTTARWIREFVSNHPEYKNDSVVSNEVCTALCRELDIIRSSQRRSGWNVEKCWGTSE